MREPGLDERRQVGGDDDGGDVPCAGAGAFAGDAEVFQHGADRLLGEGRVAQAVARAVQADDEAVADELVVAGALQLGDILDAGCRAVRRQLGAGRGELRIGARLLADRYAINRRREAGVDEDAVAGHSRREVLNEISAGSGTAQPAQAPSRNAVERMTDHEAPTLIEPSAMTVPEKTLPLSMLRTLTKSPAAPGLQRHGGGGDGERAGHEHRPAPRRPARRAMLRARLSPGCSGRGAACAWRPCLRAPARGRRRLAGSTLPGFSVTSSARRGRWFRRDR